MTPQKKKTKTIRISEHHYEELKKWKMPDNERNYDEPLDTMDDALENLMASEMHRKIAISDYIKEISSLRSRPAPAPDGDFDISETTPWTNWLNRHDTAISAQAREKLFAAIKAERDPHLDYVDWDSIEAAYNRTGGEPR